MIYYDDLPLNSEILSALGELSINYVFQPIFEADGKTVFAREALMRPTQMTVTELIEDYTKLGLLHVLEVATFFGAMQEYQLRGYDCKISVNSFPSEAFTPEEGKVFDDYYGDCRGIGIVVREQRGNDKRHRGANLMTDIHEETQLGLAHLLGMDMLLKT